MDTKPSRIWFNKVDKFIKMYDGIRYLVMYDYNRYNAIYYMIRYLISEKVVLKIVLIKFLRELSLIHRTL